MGILLNFIGTVLLLDMISLINACSVEESPFKNEKDPLALAAFNAASKSFIAGSQDYDTLKNITQIRMNTFLDLVEVVNTENAKYIRRSVVKHSLMDPFKDFEGKTPNMSEVINFVDQCLLDPAEKEKEIREEFKTIINNFKDSRSCDSIYDCKRGQNGNPMVAKCVIHKSSVLNETMEQIMTAIVEMKLTQYISEMNKTLNSLGTCMDSFLPNFMRNVKLPEYFNTMKIMNKCIAEVLKKTQRNSTYRASNWEKVIDVFKKWGPYETLKFLT